MKRTFALALSTALMIGLALAPVDVLAKEKKKKKPKPPAACSAYVPGNDWKDVPTALVTDKATEAAPIEVAIEAPPALGGGAESVFHNIQVDTAAASAGLYARYEFPVYEDHDIYLFYADGSEAGHVGGFNPLPLPIVPGGFGLDGTGNGGHSEQGAEQFDGVKTADCSGYTLRMDSFISEGGEMALKLWLGKAQYEPPPP